MKQQKNSVAPVFDQCDIRGHHLGSGVLEGAAEFLVARNGIEN